MKIHYMIEGIHLKRSIKYLEQQHLTAVVLSRTGVLHAKKESSIPPGIPVIIQVTQIALTISWQLQTNK